MSCSPVGKNIEDSRCKYVSVSHKKLDKCEIVVMLEWNLGTSTVNW